VLDALLIVHLVIALELAGLLLFVVYKELKQ